MKRQTSQLVHVQTANQHFITTPEHPFATADHKWTAARNLTPGALVISARDGAVPVSSVRHEVLAQPAPVFNLVVDESHAYLVGTNQVLVHNTGCKDGEDPDAELVHELEQASAELRAIRAAQQNARVAANRNALEQRLGRMPMPGNEAPPPRRPHLADARAPDRQPATPPKIAALKAKIAQLSEVLQRNRLARHQQTMQQIVDRRIALARNREAAAQAQRTRNELQLAGKDTREFDRQISELLRERRSLLSELAHTRVHELGRNTLDGSGWMHGGLRDLDRARLEEIRQALAEGSLTEERLLRLEEELARSEPITDAYMAAIWREIDSLDVLAMDGRLQDDLNQQFKEFEARDRALAESYESLRRGKVPLGDEAGPSAAPASSNDLAKVEKMRAHLREDWRYDIHVRLERARQHLSTIQRSPLRRSEPVEAALARIIALLEHEEQNPRF